jgi:hypothetical protein
MTSGNYKSEQACYDLVKESLEGILKSKFNSYHLEVTAHKQFSNVLQSQIDPNRDLIFAFLNDAAPDITGFVKKVSSSLREFIVVEVKVTPLKLDDIYQARKYAELFEARYAILASSSEIPAKIVRLSKVIPHLLALPAYQQLTLARFEESGRLTDWFPTNPFVDK